MKRIFVLIMVLALSATFSMPAFADTYSITINKAKEDATYKAFKIFDVTNSADAYSYTFNNANFDGTNYSHKDEASILGVVEAMADSNLVELDSTAIPGVFIVKPGSALDGLSADAQSALLGDFFKSRFEAGKFPSSPTASGQSTGSGDSASASISITEKGYYFVTTTQGTIVSVDTLTGTSTIEDKNDEPTITKSASQTNYQFGEGIYYTSHVTLKKGITKAIFYDKFPEGVTFRGTNLVQVKINNGNSESPSIYCDMKDGGYSISGSSFELHFKESFLNNLTDDTDVAITYWGRLNESATLGKLSENPNQNTAYLQWGNSPDIRTIEATASVTTSAVEITKVGDKGTLLSDVTFKVYSSTSTSANPLRFIELANGHYRPAVTENNITENGYTEILTTDSNGKIFIDLTKKQDYYFEEIEAKPGYQLPTSRFPVPITKEGETTTATFENHTGTELPSTGGVGTMIFVAIGFIAVFVAGVFLIANKRMQREFIE